MCEYIQLCFNLPAGLNVRIQPAVFQLTRRVECANTASCVSTYPPGESANTSSGASTYPPGDCANTATCVSTWPPGESTNTSSGASTYPPGELANTAAGPPPPQNTRRVSPRVRSRPALSELTLRVTLRIGSSRASSAGRCSPNMWGAGRSVWGGRNEKLSYPFHLYFSLSLLLHCMCALENQTHFCSSTKNRHTETDRNAETQTRNRGTHSAGRKEAEAPGLGVGCGGRKSREDAGDHRTRNRRKKKKRRAIAMHHYSICVWRSAWEEWGEGKGRKEGRKAGWLAGWLE